MIRSRSEHFLKMFTHQYLGFATLFPVCLAFPQLILDDLNEDLTSPTNGETLNRTKRATGDCSTTLQEFKGKEPLFIKNAAELYRPVSVLVNTAAGAVYRAVFNIPNGNIVHIACPGKSNYIRYGRKRHSKLTLSCKNSKFQLGGNDVDMADLGCAKTEATGSAWLTNANCEGGGRYVQIGFEAELPQEVVRLPQMTACHHIASMTTYYVSHTVYGTALKGAGKDEKSRSFCKRTLDLYKGADMTDLYNTKEQKAKFDALLGAGAGNAFIFVGPEYYLAKGHLAPDADFVSVSGQAATYVYVNAAPQWHRLNNGYWKKIEIHVRKVAAQMNVDLNVYTGTHNVLKLQYNRVMRDIYLVNPTRPNIKLPVPEVFWKIVQHPHGQCIVAVAHNNLFLAAPPAPLCQPIRVPAGWPDNDYNNIQGIPDLTKGFIYYCDYPSFRNSVAASPRNLQCSGVF